jgi:hypothetical protein
MRNYFFHVHPLLPLLNESKVWEMYSAQQHSLQDALVRSISLLTLQAMLFAACSFVTSERLHMVDSGVSSMPKRDFIVISK